MTGSSKTPIMFSALVAAVVLLCAARPAHAIFERYNLYGLSANSFALGTPAIPSQRDPLKYLSNPAFISQVYSRNYTFSFAGLSSELYPELEYKYSVFSYTKPQKNALTVAFTEDGGVPRKLVTYTFGGGSDSMYYGINLSGYKFEVDGQDSSGFTMDLGIMFAEKKITYGMAVKNFLSSTSAIELQGDGNEVKRDLSQVVSFGFEYRVRPDMRMNLAWHRFRTDPASSDPDEQEKSVRAVTLGFEYDIPGGTSFRMAGSQEKGTVSETTQDKLMLAGVGYRSPQYSVGYGFMNKSNYYSTAQAVTLAYKVGGSWDAPPVSDAASVPAPDTVKAEPVFEEPLPVIELAKADDIQNVIYGDKMPAASNNVSPVFEKDPLAISDVSISPQAIIIPAYSRPVFNDIQGHWAEKYIAALSQDGYLANSKPGAFNPDALVSREEFYRMLFVTQLSRLFDKPIVVLFSTKEPLRAEVTLHAAHMDKPMNLVAGKYADSGEKRLLLDREIFAKRGVFPGRYTLRVHLYNDTKEGYIEEQITVLDSSVDFSSIASLSGETREARVQELIHRIGALGLAPGYLQNLSRQGSVTRIEALTSTLQALGAAAPGDFDSPPFSDVSVLSKPERSAVYMGSRGLPSLGGNPLMAGYNTREFRPGGDMTRAEAAALIYRAARVDAAEFKGPYRRADHLYSQAGSDTPAARYYPSQGGSSQLVYENPPPRYTVPEAAAAPAPAPQPQESAPQVKYLVVAGNYMNPQRAQAALDELSGQGFPAYTLYEQIGNTTVYNVVLNAYDDSDAAQALAQTVIPGYKLKVRRIISGGGALNETLPVPAAARRGKPGYSPDRDVRMNVQVGNESRDNVKSGATPVPLQAE